MTRDLTSIFWAVDRSTSTSAGGTATTGWSSANSTAIARPLSHCLQSIPAKEAQDRVPSLFADAKLDFNGRFTIEADPLPLTAEKLRGIGQHGDVVEEQQLENLLDSIARVCS